MLSSTSRLLKDFNQAETDKIYLDESLLTEKNLLSKQSKQIYKIKLNGKDIVVKSTYHAGEGSELFQEAESERVILKNLFYNGYPVVNYIGYYFTNECYYIASEYLENGNLSNYLHTHTLTLAQRYHFIKEITYALKIFHDNKIIHGDIKPTNILITNNLEIKFCDVAFTKIEDEKVCTAGSLGFIAPEVLSGQAQTTKSDIYGLGGVYEEIAGNEKQQTKIAELISWCRHDNYKERPTCDELIIAIDSNLKV